MRNSAINDLLRHEMAEQATWPREPITPFRALVGDPRNDGEALSPDVRAMNTQIAAAATEAREAHTEFERLRTELSGTPDATDPNSTRFKATNAARVTYQELTQKHAALLDGREQLLAMAFPGQYSDGGNGPEPGLASDGPVISELKQPGTWLSTVLERRKAHVHSINEERRYKAAAVPIVTSEHINSHTETRVMIDLLTPLTASYDAGFTIVPIDGTSTRLPRFTALPEAAWTGEGEELPESGPGIEMLELTPGKCGLVTKLPEEVFDDLRPAALAMIQLQILRAIAVELDAGVLFGDGTGEIPEGIASADGVQTVLGPLNSMGVFSTAIAKLIAAGARPGAIICNPLDLASLLQVVEWNTSSGQSNKPLWNQAITGPTGLRLPFYDTPIFTTKGAPEGKALVVDPDVIAIILRRPADLAIDPFYGFRRVVAGLRSYIRATVLVGQPEGVVVVTIGTAATAAASTDVVSSPGHDIKDGDQVRFSDLTGGAGLDDETAYYARDVVAGTSLKVAATLGGAAIDITTNMTAGKVRRVPAP